MRPDQPGSRRRCGGLPPQPRGRKACPDVTGPTMRIAILAATLAALLPTSLLAQGFNASIAGDIGSGLNAGLQGGVPSGLFGSFGPERRSAAQTEMGPYLPEFGGCAPGQFDLNHSGCRPLREFSADSISTYDLSVQAMSPLSGMTLQGMTLSAGPGPAGPLD